MNQLLRAGDLATDATGVRIENVNFSYGTNHVLKDVNLEIKPGEFFAFLGPSGCGKTTLLRLIAGFNQADTGRVLIGTKDISHLPPWKRDVGMVFQSYALWPHLTVRRNVAFGLEERKIPRREIERRVAAALDLVGLTALADRRPSQLSGGQQQRVAVARALASRPRIIFADEPTGNLDSRSGAEVLGLLKRSADDFGQTVVMVTHDPVAAGYTDRVVFLADGKVVDQMRSPTSDGVLDYMKKLGA